MTKNIRQLKIRLLFSTMQILSYEKFDINIIAKACVNIGIKKEYAKLLFPNGRLELLDEFSNYINKKMIKRINKELIAITSITTRIFESIKIRLEILEKYKLAVSKITTFYLKPWNYSKSCLYIWNIMNIIWRIGGRDKSTDINYYTKRGLLTGIYLSTILHWLSDKSIHYQDTYRLLNRKLKTITTVGRKINLFTTKVL